MAASNIAKIILAAVSGLMGGWANSRQALQDRKLKEREFEDKREERLAKANEPTDAIRNFLHYMKIKQAGGGPAEQLAFASMARGGNPLLYQIDPGSFAQSQLAGKQYKGEPLLKLGSPSGGGGGHGGRPSVRRPSTAAPPPTGAPNLADLQAKARAALAKRQGGG